MPAIDLPQPALDDVLEEQLRYLMHHGERCPVSCPECIRLEVIKRFLLRPFMVEVKAKAAGV